MSRTTRALVRVFVVGVLLLAASLMTSDRTYAQESPEPAEPLALASAAFAVPAIDFTFLDDIPQDVKDALALAMQQEGNLLPWQESYTVTYLDVGEEWITGSLVPR